MNKYNIPDNIADISTKAEFEQFFAETERQISTDISDCWTWLGLPQNAVATTSEEIRAVRQLLGERLHEMKQLLARPGRNGHWSSFLQEQGIPQSIADDLVVWIERLLAL